MGRFRTLQSARSFRRKYDAALDWLFRAYDTGLRFAPVVERDPILAPLRTHTRFRELVDRMQRDVEGQRQRARERGFFDLQPLVAAAQ